MRTLSLAVVGADFPNKRGPGRRFEIAICAPGEVIHLVPEPKNLKDPHAIMVMSCRGVQIGYVTAERAPWIGGMMGYGREVRAIFQEATSWGAVVRITLDGSDPVLPARAAPAVEEQDFWPDEVWPDE